MSFVEELVCDAYALGDDLFFFLFLVEAEVILWFK